MPQTQQAAAWQDEHQVRGCMHSYRRDTTLCKALPGMISMTAGTVSPEAGHQSAIDRVHQTLKQGHRGGGQINAKMECIEQQFNTIEGGTEKP